MASSVQATWQGRPVIRDLRVGPKLMLAGFLLLLPFLLGLAWFVRQNYMASGAPEGREALSVHLILDVQQLLTDLEIVRVTSVSLASGDSRLANEVGAAEAKAVNTDVDTIDASDNSNQQLGTLSTWASLAELIRATIKASERMHAEDSVTRYEEVTGKVNDFVLALRDTGLGQDTDASTSACLQLMLDAQDSERRFGVAAELIASRGALRQNLNTDDTTELIRLTALIDHDEEAADLTYRKAVLQDPALRPRLEDGFNGFKAACDGFISYIQTGVLANGGDLPRAVHGHAVTALTGAGKFITLLLSSQAVLLQARQEQARQALRKTLAAALGALVVAVVLAWVIGREVTLPLQEVVRAIRASQRGDFSVPIPAVERGDEFGQLNAGLIQLVSGTGNVMQGLQEAVVSLTETTSHITRLTHDQSGATTRMAGTMTDTATVVEELKQGLRLAGQGAEQVTRNAQEAVAASVAGHQAIERAFAEIKHVQEVTVALGEALRRLYQQTSTITEVTETVNRFAEQCNTVAYNLAADPTTGAGWSVVAQDVRRLAEQSQQTTIRVRTLVGEIQTAAGSAAGLADQIIKAGQEGLRQATEAGAAIRTVSTRVGESAATATQISAATNPLLGTIDAAASSMNGLRVSGSTAVQSLQALQGHAQALYRISEQLKASLGQTSAAP